MKAGAAESRMWVQIYRNTESYWFFIYFASFPTYLIFPTALFETGGDELEGCFWAARSAIRPSCRQLMSTQPPYFFEHEGRSTTVFPEERESLAEPIDHCPTKCTAGGNNPI